MYDVKNGAQNCACSEISALIRRGHSPSRDLTHLLCIRNRIRTGGGYPKLVSPIQEIIELSYLETTVYSFCSLANISLWMSGEYRMSNFFNLKARAAAAATNAGSSKAATPPKTNQTLQPWVEK